MASPAAARAERALRERHRTAWPANAYSYDLDEVRRSTGRTILVEVPAGLAAFSVEYKAVDDGPLDLADLQFQIAGDVTRPELPAYVAQFTHPELDPPQPWAFRLWPLNDAARVGGAVELTEQAYVQYAYLLAGGVASAGGGVDVVRDRHGRVTEVAAWIGRWSELAHLDDRHPDPAVWPDVIPARPRAFARVARPSRLVQRRFLAERGHPLDEGDPAPVVALARRRDLGPTRPGPVSEARKRLAALRASPTQPDPAIATSFDVHPVQLDLFAAHSAAATGAAPVALVRDRRSLDRWSRARVELAADYRRLWAAERASDDNRDLWRAFDPDGSPRWSR